MMQPPTFKQALRFWLKLGFISFGGPAGQIAIMHDFLVDQKKWVSNSKFMHALNYCMILPGPEAQQLATYIGWLLHGTWGALTAGILFVLPSMFLLLALSIVYVLFGSVPWINALFFGLKPAIIAIVILALIKIGKKSLLSPFHYFVALAAFIAIFFFNVPFPFIIVGAIVLAAISRKVTPRFFALSNNKTNVALADESNYYINSSTVTTKSAFSLWQLLKQFVFTVLLWLTPFVLLQVFSADPGFWKRLSLFFTEAALVTFGGAYAVLPYVAQVSVAKFHWLNHAQMIDGLALGETTPGPLIMVLVFVGFMAGFNYFGSSIAMGALALLVTTFYTFLPCFFFIFAGAPVIEHTQQNKILKSILPIVTAAVVGVVLNLTIFLGQAVLFPNGLVLQHLNYVSLIWMIVSFVAMFRFKVAMIPWIGISAGFGLVYYLLSS